MVPSELQTLNNSIIDTNEAENNFKTEKVFLFSNPKPGVVKSPQSSTMTYSNFVKNDPSREHAFLNLRQITHELADAYLVHKGVKPQICLTQKEKNMEPSEHTANVH